MTASGVKTRRRSSGTGRSIKRSREDARIKRDREWRNEDLERDRRHRNEDSQNIRADLGVKKAALWSSIVFGVIGAVIGALAMLVAKGK